MFNLTVRLYFLLADPDMVGFNPYVVQQYVDYLRMQARRQAYIKQVRENQERLRNATLEAQKKGQQVNWHDWG